MQVYAQLALRPDELQQLLADAGFAIERIPKAEEFLTVVRGARARYSFTLGLPMPLDAEDVPEEITAVVLHPAFLYEVIVEGSSSVETPHAIRFARRLARASAGVVFDQQMGGVWVPGKRGRLRAVPQVSSGTVDIVNLQWYVQSEGTGATAAQAWLDLARRHLPEASPRRFGRYEPLSMKLDVDGPDAFVHAAEAPGLLFFKASAPCIEGHVHGGADPREVRSHSLSVHRSALDDERWRTSLRRLFTDFAAATGAVFASADVQRGLDWSGRSIWHCATAERSTFLAPGGRWMGLLPYPAWWSWFGPVYVPLVIDHLPADRVVHASGGIFHARSDRPVDRDELTTALRETGRSWLPGELLPAIATGDAVSNPPLSAATRIPRSLRSRSRLWPWWFRL